MKGRSKPAKARCRGTFSEIGARRKGKARRIVTQSGFDGAARLPIFGESGPWKGTIP
ncbi:hypothetical protein ShzoTeo12_29880 [Shinella zoogloeoides]|nr:hypothetical protein ShzoTeo12_29880 [Shinella zoogloeoides]